MKQNMMIVKCDIVSSNEKNPSDSIFEIEMIPLTTVRKVTTMEEIMNGGSMEEMIDTALQHQKGQMRSSMHIPLGEWRDKGYKIGSHVTLELLPE